MTSPFLVVPSSPVCRKKPASSVLPFLCRRPKSDLAFQTGWC